MPLHLKIENETSLPDGGPIAITVTAQRGIDIGRDQYLDWVLPDPTRFISGKHCEIRFRDGAYRLIDVSTNGTFVNAGEFRIDGPHLLTTGDRIDIGPFIISVVVEPEAGEGDARSASAAESVPIAQVWDAPEAAPPVDPRLLKEPNVRRGIGSADVLDWISEMPLPVRGSMPPPVPPSVPPSMPQATLQSTPPTAPPPMPGPLPQPSRPAPAAGAIRWDLTQHPYGSDAPTVGPEMTAPEPPVDRPPSFADNTMPAAEPAPAPQPEIAPEPEAPKPQAAAPRMPAAAPLAVPSRPAAPGDGAEFIRRFAKGLGLPEEAIAARSAGDLAEELGVLVRATADNLKQLQTARAQSKGAMRSANATMVQALDNNPLKFAPTTEDALRILFGPRTTSYLDARRTLEGSFTDIKKHQALVFSAMQTALRQLIEDLDPERIEAAVPSPNGVSGLLKSRPGELWNHYQLTWKAKAGRSEHKMLDVYMRLFAEAYDAASR